MMASEPTFFSFRPAISSDSEKILAIYQPFVEETTVSFEYECPSVTEMANRIDAVTHWLPWIVCEQAGEVMGYAYATPHRARKAYQWAVETSVYLSKAAWGKNIGRELYLTLFDFLKAQGYRQALAGISLPNPQSVGFHEKMGFVKVSHYPEVGYKNGSWIDVGWWRLQLSHSSAIPSDPIPWKSLAGCAEILQNGSDRLNAWWANRV